MTEQEQIRSVAMRDSTPEWRYEIKHGPDGEANYAWLYYRADMIAVMKTHHAVALTAALSRPVQEPVAYTSEMQLKRMAKDPGQNYVMWGEWLPYHHDIPLYATPQPAHGTFATDPAPSVISRGSADD